MRPVPNRDTLYVKENIEYLKDECMSAPVENVTFPSVLAAAACEDSAEESKGTVAEVVSEFKEEEVRSGTIF